jgi:hypothetical protein
MRFCSRAYLLLQRPPSTRPVRLPARKTVSGLKHRSVRTIITGSAVFLFAPPAELSLSQRRLTLPSYRSRFRSSPLPCRPRASRVSRRNFISPRAGCRKLFERSPVRLFEVGRKIRFFNKGTERLHPPTLEQVPRPGTSNRSLSFCLTRLSCADQVSRSSRLKSIGGAFASGQG